MDVEAVRDTALALGRLAAVEPPHKVLRVETLLQGLAPLETLHQRQYTWRGWYKGWQMWGHMR
jgi:hypothetical protein